ncbi:MAG: hypothetical protein UHD04_07170 [Muribaculaceae bacterium]|jgi:regulator of replication initiation timing|nr:hypothetical protein [Muribaculaceae bacterium]MEE1338713.1 hypothetical protein [Muribaculaceae bacterium]
MATDLHSTIQRILGKTDVLVEKYQALVEELGEVEAEVRKLRNENASLVKENQMLRQENDYLKLARSIVPSQDRLEESKAIVNQLVRDVDKCISQLTCK